MNLLVLDDDFLVREAMKLAIGDEHRLVMAASFESAVSLLDSEEIDGAFIDIQLQGGDGGHNGFEFLTLFKKRFPDKPGIIISGYREVDTVVRCIKMGADDYLEKPFDKQTLDLKIAKVFSDSQRNRVFKRAFEKSEAAQQLIGDSAGLLKARKSVEEAAGLKILFYGETGVGKTPFALYSNYIVSQIEGEVRPFEQINCACLNTEQFQDQLFGHKKGAFTGAISDKRGLVELAKGGDLFLDEIGEMPLETQALFLTFLDSMEFYRLGDDVKRKAQVRVLSATNRNLKQMVAEGKFRKDLYSRISQVIVEIPPLRERKEDIKSLFEYFIKRYAGYEMPYSLETLRKLEERSWEEGNVRELQDITEYLCLKARGFQRIEVFHLGENAQSAAYSSVPITATDNALDADLIFQAGLENYLDNFEKEVLKKCLEKHSGTLDEMARELRVSRPTLYRRLKHHDLGAHRDQLSN
jgi:DNA-binding NtrC family response regulator